SNIFNMVLLAVSDPVYTSGTIISAVSGSHMIIAVGVLVMMLLVLSSLFRKKTVSTISYAIPSAIVIVVYFIASYVNFTY
ncbi:MAG TPA: sodium:calcium antiporter, partial [Planococcus sp. (in: firmicutes)]|nr:sodium:calcium antiporter [Planococcus sp. (in: firmicutes)]